MNFKNLIVAFVLLSITTVFSKSYAEENTSIEESRNAVLTQDSSLDMEKMNQLLTQKEAIERDLIENNIWSKIYSNYHTYQELEQQQTTLNTEIIRLKNTKNITKEEQEALQNAQDNMITLLGKLQLLKEYQKDPFKKFLTPPTIGAVPKVESPFAVIGALSYREKLESDMEAYNNRYESLQLIVEKFNGKQLILKKLLKLDP
ncbi:MAG: mechanosensitive ion channel family protein, partial [Sulfurovum sp.]|nr:mechanosensitive ion channel family protein [Sulfurovum sp.]NNJ45879.1 mechanosensitive ion channel family protein [Sulfurovum sp.]